MRDPLQQGHRIRDTYDVVRVLGTSELSCVYLTRASNGRHYVVREICPPVESRRHMERVIAHVHDEIQRVQKFSHPGLPRIVEQFVCDEVVYVVREYGEEPTLIEVVEHMRGLPPESQVRGWMVQLLEVFAYLHGQQPPFVFSGLRPEMVTVSKMGRVHIRDYPTTCFLPVDMQWKHARRTAPGYISPEQERGEEVTVRSDVFNLGQLYFFLLTGRDPSLYPYSRQLLSSTRPEATQGLLELLDSATRKHAPDRLQSVGELRQLLTGGGGRGRRERELGFRLDKRSFRVERVRQGAMVRGKFKLTSTTGREVYGKVRSDREWIRFKFDVFRASTVDLEFSVSTFEFVQGETYQGLIQVDTDVGVDEVEVEIAMEASFAARLTRGFKSIFTRESTADADF